MTNAFEYPDAVWVRFERAAHAGTFAAGQGRVIRVSAGTPAGKSVVSLAVKLDGPTIAEAKFQAYGCPVTIAVGEWLAEHATGRALQDLRAIDAAQIRAALEIPADRAHCAVLGEDVVRALLKQVAKQ